MVADRYRTATRNCGCRTCSLRTDVCMISDVPCKYCIVQPHGPRQYYLSNTTSDTRGRSRGQFGPVEPRPLNNDAVFTRLGLSWSVSTM